MQGYDIDSSSAGSIQQSLRALRQAGEDKIILDILQLQVVKPMKVKLFWTRPSQDLLPLFTGLDKVVSCTLSAKSAA